MSKKYMTTEKYEQIADWIRTKGYRRGDGAVLAEKFGVNPASIYRVKWAVETAQAPAPAPAPVFNPTPTKTRFQAKAEMESLLLKMIDLLEEL